MDWWAANRLRQRRVGYMLWIGLPLGFLFSVPIFLNFLAGRLWYKRADAVGASQFNPLVLVVAVTLIAAFTGFLYRQRLWERHEQRYLSLQRREEAAGKEMEAEAAVADDLGEKQA